MDGASSKIATLLAVLRRIGMATGLSTYGFKVAALRCQTLG